jgi:hypothetical protein
MINIKIRSSIGVCIPYFSRIPAILLINNVSFALAFADSHSSICFSIVESSLAIPKYTKYNEEKSTKTTIRHLEIQKEPIGTPHNIWNCVKNKKLPK